MTFRNLVEFPDFHYKHPAQWPSGGVSALRMVSQGFNPRLGHTNDSKIGTVQHLVFRVGLAGFDHQIITKCSTAAHRSLQEWIKWGGQHPPHIIIFTSFGNVKINGTLPLTYTAALVMLRLSKNLVKLEFAKEQWVFYCNSKTLIAPLCLRFTLSIQCKVVLEDKYTDMLTRK